MSKSKKMAKSALIVIILTLGSKVLGFFRVTLVGQSFGTGMVYDTFVMAMAATSMITSFITASVGTTFIPILSEIEAKEGKEGRISHTNNMLNIIFAISLVLVVFIYITSPLIITLVSRGAFKGNQYILAVQLMRLGTPMILFGGIMGVFTGFLQYEERFISTSLIGFALNFVYIIYLLCFSTKFGIKGLMVAAVIGTASQFLILIPEAIKIGYRYSFKLDLKDKYVNMVIYLSVPVLIGVAINDINSLVDKMLASRLPFGSISALDFSNKLNTFILGVFIATVTTIVFPLLSKESNVNNMYGIKKIMEYGVNLILIITVPATVGLIVLRTPIIQVAFERGKFDAIATALTSPALMFYSIGLVPMSLRLFLNKLFYSLQDTKTPMINSAIAVVCNVIFSLILVEYMDHSGIAFATSIASTVATLLMFYSLRRKIGNLGTVDYLITLIKTCIAAVTMGFIVSFIYNGLYGVLEVSRINNAIALFVSTGVGVVVYGVFCHILRIKEVIDILSKLTKVKMEK